MSAPLVITTSVVTAAPPLSVHLMTASLTPGDAIGNYLLTTARILRGWGVRVQLYADYVAPQFGAQATLARYYRPRGGDILWFHFSIDSPNIAQALATDDYLLIDYHGISPPALFPAGSHLRALCERALALRPRLAARADGCLVHSDTMRAEWIAAGAAPERVVSVPLCIDTARFAGGPDAALAERLARLDYLLFVGRIVPQKDILALLRLLAALRPDYPRLALLIVGSDHLAPAYRRDIDREIARLGLTERVFLPGPVTDARQLAALFRHARLYCALSEWESFCVPVAEALYFGTPAVVQAVPPLPEVAGPAGIVIDKHDSAAAAARLRPLLDDAAAYARLSASAAVFAHRYTDVALSRNLLTALRRLFNLMSENSGAPA